MIINAQARRMDEQRANLILPGLHDRAEILQKLSRFERERERERERAENTMCLDY